MTRVNRAYLLLLHYGDRLPEAERDLRLLASHPTITKAHNVRSACEMGLLACAVNRDDGSWHHRLTEASRDPTVDPDIASLMEVTVERALAADRADRAKQALTILREQQRRLGGHAELVRLAQQYAHLDAAPQIQR